MTDDAPIERVYLRGRPHELYTARLAAEACAAQLVRQEQHGGALVWRCSECHGRAHLSVGEAATAASGTRELRLVHSPGYNRCGDNAPIVVRRGPVPSARWPVCAEWRQRWLAEFAQAPLVGVMLSRAEGVGRVDALWLGARAVVRMARLETALADNCFELCAKLGYHASAVADGGSVSYFCDEQKRYVPLAHDALRTTLWILDARQVEAEALPPTEAFVRLPRDNVLLLDCGDASARRIVSVGASGQVRVAQAPCCRAALDCALAMSSATSDVE